MKKKILLLSFCVLLIMACQNEAQQEADMDALQVTLAETQASFQKLQDALTEMKAQETDAGKLVHIVFFKLKPDVDKEVVLNEITELQGIDFLEELEIGFYEDLGDKRALSDYDVVMQMNLTDEAAYQKYQAHPLHLELKKNLGAFLAAPPATYDFVVK